ncbi:MAG: SpoIID/LytB domain-containing protein [Gemmatimonadota bacterium]|nr:SpoIID/LytB domain-containing protein [Gemmatimonadota bacterium]
MRRVTPDTLSRHLLGLGIALLLLVTLQACPRPSATTAPLAGQPDLRIGLEVDAGRVRIGGQGAVAVVAGGQVATRLTGGSEATLTRDGRDVVLTIGAEARRFERISFVSLAQQSFVHVNGAHYRGVVDVYPGDRGLTVVNELPIEQYLLGVVNAEMGRRSASEQAALEAQAIVARTYALRNRGKFGAEGFDLRSSVADQAYGGIARETAAGRAAVDGTAGMVLTYRGDLAAPFFHSTCGSSTAAADEAFRSVPSRPYLRPVSDRHGDGYYCDISPRFQWSVEWDGETLARILRRTVPAIVGIDGTRVDVVRGVRVHRRGPSGRATELRIEVGSGEIPVFGPDLRAVLETPDGRPLGSTVFETEVGLAAGAVSRLTVRGRGWGHGVGMCQWGAVGRARAGQSATKIVTTYFPGARLERWY